jgi:electron transfer DM13
VLKRLPQWARWLVIVAVLVGAPIVWYLGSPLFINRTVDEPFPQSTGAQGADAYPMSKNATIPGDMTQQQVEARMMEVSGTETKTDDAMPNGASASTVVARGIFVDGDNFHKGQGTATIYKVGPDLILRLDAFKSTNGPDLRVLLTRTGMPKTRSDVQAGYIEVAKLKGNVGNQNYTLPKDVMLSDYKAVVIYCRPFHVVFATATLKAAN